VHLLRASGEQTGHHYDLAAINGDGDGSVQHGAALAEFAEAIEARDRARLDGSRAALMAALGPAGLVDAAAVAAIFNGLVRVADATGIPLEDDKAEQTAEFRTLLGIGKYAESGR
jgi:hypothetical protein